MNFRRAASKDDSEDESEDESLVKEWKRRVRVAEFRHDSDSDSDRSEGGLYGRFDDWETYWDSIYG